MIEISAPYIEKKEGKAYLFSNIKMEMGGVNCGFL